MTETLPQYVLNSWYGFMVPKGTPKAIVARLHDEAVKAVKAPDVQDWMKLNGLDPQATSPEEFAALVRADLDKWAKIIKAAKLTNY
jgi:tripartite-type tricarboxylate transporter receptor subunit TctC